MKELEGKKLLILGGGATSMEIVKAAHALGVYVIVTDYYDTVRIYQFPIAGNFAITELRHKRWKRCLLGASPKR